MCFKLLWFRDQVERYGNPTLLLLPTCHPSLSIKYLEIVGVQCESHCCGPLILQRRKLIKERACGRIETRTQIFLNLLPKWSYLHSFSDFKSKMHLLLIFQQTLSLLIPNRMLSPLYHATPLQFSWNECHSFSNTCVNTWHRRHRYALFPQTDFVCKISYILFNTAHKYLYVCVYVHGYVYICVHMFKLQP